MQLTVAGVTKTYRRGSRDVPVLRGCFCDFPAGSFTFVVGPSGSGKSSLLYLLAALDSVSGGEIRADGRPLNGMSVREADAFRREQVGFIFQSFNLLSNLTALDNVLVPLIPQGITATQRQQARELLGRAGLGDRLDHTPLELSGGEQQRVAIVRALLKQPPLVLADEPTGELDSRTGDEIMTFLRELHSQQGSTVVVVTHDQRYFRPGDRVIRIHDGQTAPAEVIA